MSERLKGELSDAIDKLVEKYPEGLDDVKWPRDWRRVVYDVAMKTRWDRKVEAPFVQNASPLQLRNAVNVARLMLDSRATAINSIRESQRYVR